MTSPRGRGPQRPRGRGRRQAGPPLAIVAAVVAAAVVTVVVVLTAGGDGGGSGVEEAEVAHVHGLGVNPADDDLYVATHHGVFRIGKDGKAARVGDRAQDTMGFTVAGPDHFLASGHPDLRDFEQGKRPLLGLIESTDGAESWQSLSLDGEADFHGLAAAHGLVYGYDSTGGRFMVRSADGRWDVRSTTPLAGFAVDPSDADHIVAAGADGVLDSDDGGRTWSPLDGPLLAAVAWDSHGDLFGVAPDGTVHRSSDAGVTWEQAGRLDGQPQALLARSRLLYAAAADDAGRTGIYRSEDEGQTWSLFYRDRA